FGDSTLECVDVHGQRQQQEASHGSSPSKNSRLLTTTPRARQILAKHRSEASRPGALDREPGSWRPPPAEGGGRGAYQGATENAFGMCRMALTPPSSLMMTETTSNRQGV